MDTADVFNMNGLTTFALGEGLKAEKDAFGRVIITTSKKGDVYTKAEVDQKIEAIELTPGPQGPQGPKGDPGTSVTVDAALSATSTNPVQNKVIQAKIAEIEERLTALETPTA